MDTLELLKELIKIDSSTISGANKTVEYAKDILDKNGIKGEIVENKGYKSYVCKIGKGGKTLVLNGHLDVVPGNEEAFQPYENDRKIYGRGSADMKAGCAAMINTIIKLKDVDLPCEIMLQLVSDEEAGGHHCSEYLVENGYTGDFMICPEPTGLGMSIKAKGFLRLDIIVNGNSAHGSRPWEGDNAIVRAIETYDKILNLPIIKEKSELYPESTGSSVNLAIIEGGDLYNKVPDKCKIGLDIRFAPHLEADKVIEEIKSVVEWEVVVNFIGHSVNTATDHPYVLQLVDIIKDITSKEEVNIYAQYGSGDIRFFAKHNMPCANFGPSGAFWHGDGEYVNVQSIYDFENVLEKFIMNFN